MTEGGVIRRHIVIPEAIRNPSSAPSPTPCHSGGDPDTSPKGATDERKRVIHRGRVTSSATGSKLTPATARPALRANEARGRDDKNKWTAHFRHRRRGARKLFASSLRYDFLGPGGGTGRRMRLKIVCPLDVWVRVPPRVHGVCWRRPPLREPHVRRRPGDPTTTLTSKPRTTPYAQRPVRGTPRRALNSPRP